MRTKFSLLLSIILTTMLVIIVVNQDKQINDLNIGLNMQQEANKGLLQHIAKYESQLHEKDLKIDELQKKIDSSKNIWIPVEVTYYSSKEMTDIAKYAPMNCYGGYLQEGDYSAPDFLPIGTEFAIKYADGYTETGIVKDRGATWAIKVFSRGDNKIVPKATMRLDKYVSNVEGKGVDSAMIQILKWGK